jgi:hypothetical protein
VLEENVPVVQAFLVVQTQLGRRGFSYAGVEAGLRMSGIWPSPELFRGLRVMEAAVRDFIAEQSA